MLVPLSSGFVMMLHKSQAAVKNLCSSTSKKLRLLKSTAFGQISLLIIVHGSAHIRAIARTKVGRRNCTKKGM